MKFAPISAICLIPLLLGAADTKWMQKDYTQWTPAQAQRMLNDSPWAHEAAAFMGTTDEDARDFPVSMPTPRDAGLGGREVNDGHWDGGVGRLPKGGNATLPVMVRWESALPVREALFLSHSKETTDTEHTLSEPEKYYVITVEGLVRGRPTPAAPDPDSAPTADNPANGGRVPVDINVIRQGLLNMSRLYPRDKKAIVPSDVRIDEQTGIVRIYFPKNVPIDLQDKEVTFETNYGSIKVAQRYKLKDMLYHGKLEL
jgi:hypothetical protein